MPQMLTWTLTTYVGDAPKSNMADKHDQSCRLDSDLQMKKRPTWRLSDDNSTRVQKCVAQTSTKHNKRPSREFVFWKSVIHIIQQMIYCLSPLQVSWILITDRCVLRTASSLYTMPWKRERFKTNVVIDNFMRSWRLEREEKKYMPRHRVLN